MHLFRMRLIFALIVSVTLVSVASTYFDVLAHKHMLRVELERRVKWMGTSITPDVRGALEAGNPAASRLSRTPEDSYGRAWAGRV